MKNTTFVLLFSSSSVSGGFSMVDCRPFLLVYRRPIVVLIYFLICLLMGFSVRPGQVFRKTCLISLRRLSDVGAEKFRMEILLQFWFSCLGQNVICHNFWLLYIHGNFPHYSLLVSGYFYYFLSIFWTDISCFYSVMVHPSSHKTPNDINGSVLIFGLMWICLACLLSPGSWIVAICDDFIVLP